MFLKVSFSNRKAKVICKRSNNSASVWNSLISRELTLRKNWVQTLKECASVWFSWTTFTVNTKSSSDFSETKSADSMNVLRKTYHSSPQLPWVRILRVADKVTCSDSFGSSKPNWFVRPFKRSMPMKRKTFWSAWTQLSVWFGSQTRIHETYQNWLTH